MIYLRTIASMVFVLLLLPSQGASRTDSLLQLSNSLEGQDRVYFLDSVTYDHARDMLPDADPLFKALLSLESDKKVSHASRWARYRINQGDLSGARIALEHAREFSESTDKLDQKRLFHYDLSFINELDEKLDSARYEIEQAIVFSEQLADSSTIVFGECYKAKGRVLQGMGEFAASAAELNKAKEIFMAVDDSVGVSEAMMQLGILYAMIGLFDESEAQILGRYEWLRVVSPITEFRDLVNLGRNDLTNGKPEAAYLKYSKGLEKMPFKNSAIWLNPYVLNGLVESMYFTGRDTEIPAIYDHMVDSFGQMREEEGFRFLYDQSQFFNELVSGNFDKAEDLALSLYEGSVAKKDPSEAMLHAQFLTELYKKSGDSDRALKYAELYGDLRDSTQTANKTNALLLLQTEFETKEKEAEIVQLAAEKKFEQERSRFFLALTGGLAGILLIGGALFVQLRKTRNRLAEQNVELEKLNATKNKFFRIIGHDLRNPIITFKALGNRIRRQRKNKDAEGVDESLDLIGKSTDQVKGLLDNLMEWVLSQDGLMPYEPTSIDLAIVARENVTLFEEMAKEKGIALSSSVGSNTMVHADVNALNGAIRNLVSNAIKFTDEGGSVELSAQNKNGMMQCQVSDTGRGMDEAKLAELFSVGVRSERGTSGEKGTGLGLPLVKELVELNKGTVTVQSELGKGTVFNISIPKA